VPGAVTSDLFDRRLVIVGGKGGVGRTTVTAALALSAVRRGKRVLVVQTNAKQGLARLLGVPSIGEDVVQVREGLHAVNTNPRAALREYGLMVLRFETVYRAVFENRMVRSLLRAVPGLDDYSLLGKTWYHTTEQLPDGRPRWDLVLFDGPATGHLLTMLRIPKVILDAVPEGPLTRDALSARQLLTDRSRCAVVLVTLAEEMPAAEAIDFDRVARTDLGLPVPVLVVNALWPSRFVGSDPPARLLGMLAVRPPSEDAERVLGTLIERAQTSRKRRDLNERYLGRLEGELPTPIKSRLPFLFAPELGDAEAQMLSHLLDEQLVGRTLPG
jgi:anion-transporting  ArsA/GET3 family ATPase